jgi:TP901-1 family phage major tail protein
VPDFGTYSGAFRVTSLDFGGETEGAVTFSASMESTGVIAFTAA